MRRLKSVPKTALDDIAKKILSQGPNAAMPRNLPDRILRMIGRDLALAKKAQLEGRPDDESIDLSAPTFLVMALLSRQKNTGPTFDGISTEEIRQGLDIFSTIVSDEIIGRETGVFLDQYRAENIF